MKGTVGEPLYAPPSLRGFVNRHAAFSTWVDHLPFGYDLIEAQRPKIFVELGTQNGLSYFTFCQSVKAHGLSTRCHAVDSWTGDEHTGEYASTVFDGVSAHNAEHYADFSELLRMRFEEAVHRFAEDSIDLLHIDGLHTYDAVKNDFETWFPKVAPGGLVLFHDIAARMMDFGAWRYWDELSPRFPSFTFRHGFGLGVLRKPGGAPLEAPLLRYLFSDDEHTQNQLRGFYVHAARHIDLLRQRELVEKLKAGIRKRQGQG